MINITPALTCSLIALFLVAGCSEEITTPSSDNPVEPTALGEPVDFSPEIPDLRWSLTQYDNGGVLHNVDPLIPDPNYFKFNILTESLYSEERVIAAQFNCKVYQWEFRRTSATTATLGINEFVREASDCLLNDPLPPILDVFTHYTDIVMDVIDQKMRITNGNGVTLIYSAIES